MEEYEKRLKLREKTDQELAAQFQKFSDCTKKQMQLARGIADAVQVLQQGKATSERAEETFTGLKEAMEQYCLSAAVFDERLKEVAEHFTTDQLYKAHFERIKLSLEAKIPFVETSKREMIESAAQLEVETLQRLKLACVGFADGALEFAQSMQDEYIALGNSANAIIEQEGVQSAADELGFLGSSAGVRELLPNEDHMELPTQPARNTWSFEHSGGSTGENAGVTVLQSPAAPSAEITDDLDHPVRFEPIQLDESNEIHADSGKTKARKLEPRELKKAVQECVFAPHHESRIVFETEYVISGPQSVTKAPRALISELYQQEAIQHSVAQQTSVVSHPVQEQRQSPLQTTISWPSEIPHPQSTRGADQTLEKAGKPPVPSAGELQFKLRELDRLMAQDSVLSQKDSELFNQLSAVHNFFANTSSGLQSHSNTSNSGPDPVNIFANGSLLNKMIAENDASSLEVEEKKVVSSEPVIEKQAQEQPPKEEQAVNEQSTAPKTSKRKLVKVDDLL